MRSSWPVDVVALNPVSCGAVLWCVGGVLRVTVIVKASFALGAGGDADLVAPEPIEREDRFHEDDPSRSLRCASDTAPYLPGAGVVLTGHAHAPGAGPVPALSARLALFRDGPLLDKTIHVFGDRAPGSDTPAPFQEMPLVYERAQGGPGFPSNPVGLSAASDEAHTDALDPARVPGRTHPNLVHPGSPHRPAGFGPIAPHWPLRRRLFGGFEPRATPRSSAQHGAPGADPGVAGSAGVLHLPDDFDFRAFNPAPFDQQIPFLQGDEWIVMDNLNAGRARIQTRLPSARARVRRTRANVAGASGSQEIPLSADMLLIDTDRQIVSVVWRGNFAVESHNVIQELRLLAGVETRTVTVPWPEPGELAPPVQGRGRTGDVAAPAAHASDHGAVPPLHDQATRRGASLPVPREAPAALAGTGPLSKIETPVLPFRGVPAAPQAEPALAVDGTTTGPLDQKMPIPDRLAQVGAERAQFPLAAPGTSASRWELPIRELPIPGAPWSPVPAPPPDARCSPSAEVALPGRGSQPPEVEAPERGSQPPEVAALAAVPPAASRQPLAGLEVRKRAEARLAEGRDFDGDDLSGGDLAGLDFSGRSLARCAFRGAKLRGARLAGATLVEAMLEEADLRGADLSRALLTNARADGAELAEAVLEDADLRGASLSGANLQRARLARARGEGASLCGSNLEGADLEEARFAGASFVDANLRGAKAERGDFTSARFDRADLGDASFRNARLVSAVLAHARLDLTDLRGADLERANLHGAARRRAKIAGAKMKDIDETAPASPEDPGRA
ncbi:DUF2169 domain-containing protein [Sorangium sp. So ce1014]|uniref:DUF2169 family type VI secretion system accessory protein n=1 Tax=Sorangium sp. So ce1014 TaxID=3133326 RepID=UPI003F5DD92D